MAAGSAPATSGAAQYTAIAFADGAAIDSIAIGESFRLKVSRNAADVEDDITGDAEILAVELRET